MQIKNVRFIIAAITTFSAYAVYVSRVNLSMAIIAMVDDPHGGGGGGHHAAQQQQQQLPLLNSTNPKPVDADQRPNNATTFNSSSTASGMSFANVFVKSENSLKTPLISQERFHWDATEQGQILGAFFYGYILFQIPGARMSESVGARWIIMAASAGSAVISLAFPLSTQLNSIHLLMMLRFVMGLCQSAFFPAAYCLFCRWLPERERSVLLPIMFIGSNMGNISTYIMSSYLISSSYGWPSVFYLSGFICLACSLLWGVFGSNGPEDNWWISDEERKLIESNVNNQSSENNSLRASMSSDNEDAGSSSSSSSSGPDEPIKGTPKKTMDEPTTPDELSVASTKTNTLKSAREQQTKQQQQPAPRETTPDPSWSKLICSVPVWTLILSMYGNEWSNVVLCYELPTYLNSALNYPIEQNGVINSFFQLSYTVASPIMSSMGAYMLDNHVLGMRKVHVRKLFQSLATFGQMACFVSVPICGANRGLIILFMFLAIVFKACANAGDIMVSGDLSPEYAGTIFAFANSIGNTAGFIVPLLTAVSVNDTYNRVHWTPFWLTTAAIMCASGVIFLIFGETRRQDFSKEPESDVESHVGETLDLASFKVRSPDINNNNNNSSSHHNHHRLRVNSKSSNNNTHHHHHHHHHHQTTPFSNR